MRVTVLVDNRPSAGGGLPGEAGFSAWIEHRGRTLLFDTGKGSLFRDNARALGLSLETPDAVVLSHAHYDHGGGLPAFFCERRAPVNFYRHRDSLHPKYSRLGSERRFLGLEMTPEQLRESPAKTILVDQPSFSLGDGLSLESGFPRRFPREIIPPRFVREEGGEEIPDTFSDELVLTAQGEQGLTVITGCSHPGILNILGAVQDRYEQPVVCVIGGWHLKEADSERIQATLQQLEEWGIQRLGGCHCTGEPARKELAERFGSRVLDVRSGWQGDCP